MSRHSTKTFVGILVAVVVVIWIAVAVLAGRYVATASAGFPVEVTAVIPQEQYMFFEGEDHYVWALTQGRNNTFEAWQIETGDHPEVYPALTDEKTIIHNWTIEGIPVSFTQDILVKWISNDQLQWEWDDSETIKIAVDQWNVINITILSEKYQTITHGVHVYPFIIVAEGELETQIMGDINLDGEVDDDDLALLLANWGTGEHWSTGDLNGDNTVDDDDLSLLLANWGG